MFFRILLLMSLLVPLSTSATETQEVMRDALNSFKELIPHMNNEESLKDEAKRARIEQNLRDLKKTFKKADHVKALQTPNYMPSIESLDEHIDQTIKALRSENTSFALLRMRTITSLCISCHTQLPQGVGGSFSSEILTLNRGDFKSDFEFAEYLFMTRQYIKSARYYENFITTELEKLNGKSQANPGFDRHEGDQKIRKSLRRVLSINTKVNYAPKDARRFLERVDKKLENLRLTRKRARAWVEDLKKWENKGLSLRLNSPDEVRKFINDYLTPLDTSDKNIRDGSNDVLFLISSGILSKYLSHSQDNEVSAMALYWLAIADRMLDYNFFYSLSDLYLKECIHKYPRSEYAKKCLAEYRENLVYGYTGSSGVYIPEEELKELEKLEKVIKEHE